MVKRKTLKADVREELDKTRGEITGSLPKSGFIKRIERKRKEEFRPDQIEGIRKEIHEYEKETGKRWLPLKSGKVMAVTKKQQVVSNVGGSWWPCSAVGNADRFCLILEEYIKLLEKDQFINDKVNENLSQKEREDIAHATGKSYLTAGGMIKEFKKRGIPEPTRYYNLLKGGYSELITNIKKFVEVLRTAGNIMTMHVGNRNLGEMLTDIQLLDPFDNSDQQIIDRAWEIRKESCKMFEDNWEELTEGNPEIERPRIPDIDAFFHCKKHHGEILPSGIYIFLYCISLDRNGKVNDEEVKELQRDKGQHPEVPEVFWYPHIAELLLHEVGHLVMDVISSSKKVRSFYWDYEEGFCEFFAYRRIYTDEMCTGGGKPPVELYDGAHKILNQIVCCDCSSGNNITGDVEKGKFKDGFERKRRIYPYAWFDNIRHIGYWKGGVGGVKTSWKRWHLMNDLLSKIREVRPPQSFCSEDFKVYLVPCPRCPKCGSVDVFTERPIDNGFRKTHVEVKKLKCKKCGYTWDC